MTRGLKLVLEVIEAARLMSKVSPSGLWVLPGRRGLGGVFANGELKSWLKEVGDWTRELGSEAQNGRATRL